MLHRSPSGAKRKIRQRREELIQQKQSSPLNQTQENISNPDNEYRSLVDSISYRSILDDMSSYRPDTEMKSEKNIKDEIMINTFSKPEETTQPSTSIHFSINKFFEKSSEIDINKITSNYDHENEYSFPPIKSKINSFNNNLVINDNIGKPTVEVHPMPIPRTSILPNQSMHHQDLPINPPPIPKKPEKLKRKYFQEISLSSASEISESKSQSNSITGDSEISIKENEEKNTCTSNPCSSIEALDRLHTSNLVRSIEEKFDNIKLNPGDISELESRRLTSIKKLISKVTERSADLEAIYKEKEEATMTIRNLLNGHPILPKLEKQIMMRANLIQLESVACIRLHQIENLTKEHANALKDRTDYWQSKIKDIRYLAKFVSQRIVIIEETIYNYLNYDSFATYKKCMDLLLELEAENTEIEEKLIYVKKQIEQLTNISTISNNKELNLN